MKNPEQFSNSESSANAFEETDTPDSLRSKLKALDPDVQKEIDLAVNKKGYDFDQVSGEVLDAMDEEDLEELGRLTYEVSQIVDPVARKGTISKMVALWEK